ncbi:amidase [Haloarcula sp. S1CR25-12]|uniref:Amidase n=1 Tax=Haloarcula saliterrae TaxID=2950534 RepID=A0ABU2FFU7_9EURY|nr:amidase [Haloarcula sp. S1CR25-12]MDS0261132.1 amidase [Haloarcula sp. S1CR25-12]
MSYPSSIVEATIGELHAAMRRGELTSESIVDQYIERIGAYDRDGPRINSVVTVNPAARDRAAELDQRFAESGLCGPLHGIPVLVKDQVSTAGLVTTFGSEAFADYVPAEDATIVRRLKEAGAVILAKTNLPDWAAGFVGYSSVLGQTKNPYDLDRDSGGSSAGTGAGVAANLGAVGIGEDTGGSIRVPASCCNLYGLRPTTGLVSRAGLSPLVTRQDTPGPMARTVEDLARVLDVIAGFDRRDERTGAARFGGSPGSCVSAIDGTGLDGARLGVVRDVFGSDADPTAAPVTSVVETALSTMSEAGAELVDPVGIPGLQERLDTSSLHALQPKRDIDAFLAGLERPPVDSVAELHRKGAYHEGLELFETIAAAPEDPTTVPDYWERVAAQESLRETLVYLLADRDLDALVFPDVQVVPPRHAELRSGDLTRADYPVNTVISSQSSCPGISMPAGFTDDGLPVGVELLGAPHSEATLVGMAAAYERRAQTRRPPATAPPLGPD